MSHLNSWNKLGDWFEVIAYWIMLIVFKSMCKRLILSWKLWKISNIKTVFVQLKWFIGDAGESRHQSREEEERKEEKKTKQQIYILFKTFLCRSVRDQ